MEKGLREKLYELEEDAKQTHQESQAIRERGLPIFVYHYMLLVNATGLGMHRYAALSALAEQGDQAAADEVEKLSADPKGWFSDALLRIAGLDEATKILSNIKAFIENADLGARACKGLPMHHSDQIH